MARRAFSRVALDTIGRQNRRLIVQAMTLRAVLLAMHPDRGKLPMRLRVAFHASGGGPIGRKHVTRQAGRLVGAAPVRVRRLFRVAAGARPRPGILEPLVLVVVTVPAYGFARADVR